MISRRQLSGFPLRRNAVWNAFLVSVLVLSCRHCSGAISAAFIDFDKSAAGSLLESRLLANASYQWVERGQIDQVIKEKKTQALFSAAGVADRSTLGRTLKADILIMLRTAAVAANESERANAPTRQVDLVICETRRGSRLARHSIPAAESGNEVALVNQLEGWTKAALKLADRPTADTCAVPPFVSNDLSFADDYLRKAYANVAEQAVFQQGRFAVVELAEAEALSKEFTLAGEGAAVDRRLPLYLWGDYRHIGSGESRRVQLHLRLMRGKEVLAAAEKNGLVPTEVPSFLQRSTLELLAKVSGVQVAVNNPGVEARQLADRAREFINLGNSEEAMPLLEAALLLKSNDHDARRDAVIVGGKMGQRYFYQTNDPAIAIPAIRQYRRGMEHLEIWLGAHPNSPEGLLGSGKPTFVDGFPFFHFFGNAPSNTEVKPVYDELLIDIRETLLRLTRMRSRQNAPDAFRYLTAATAHLRPRERFQTTGKIALELQNLPGAEERTREFVLSYYTIQRLNDEGGVELLTELVTAGNAEVRTAAERLKKELDQSRAKTVPQTTLKDTFQGEPKFPLGSTQVTLTAVKLQVESGDQELPSFGGCLPAGPGVDVYWSDRRLFVMKEPGRLRCVWEGADLNDRFSIVSDGGQYVGSYVAYDGRYVWATVSRLRLPPLLLVLDPVTESIREITAEDGLPLVATKDVGKEGSHQFMAVTPLEPGQACVAGSFGRSWIALVTLGSAGANKVKVIHECRRVADPVDQTQWRQPDIAFDPTYVFTLSDSKTREKRVLMGRGKSSHQSNYHPLLVDPAREKVEVFLEDLPQFQSTRGLAPHDGSLFFIDYAFQEGQDIRVSRIGAPTWKRETLLHHAPQGWVVFAGDQLHIVGKRWWSCRFPAGPLHVAAAEVPWHFVNGWMYPGQTINAEFNLKLLPDQSELENIYASNHYGVLIRTNRRDNQGFTFYRPQINSTSSQKSVP